MFESGFGFLRLDYFRELLLLPLLFFLLGYLTLKRKNRRGAALGKQSPPDYLTVVLPALVFCIMVLACFRPYFEAESTEPPSLKVVLAIDVSLSMNAQDAAPDRLEAARQISRRTAQELKSKFPDLSLAVVAFAGEAMVVSPFTPDLKAVSAYIDSLSFELIEKPGSSLMEALQLSSQLLAGEAGSIILFSDGEDLGFDPKVVEAGLSRYNVTVHTVGIGTPEGIRLYDQDRQPVLNRAGEHVFTRLDENALLEIAVAGSGKYQRARSRLHSVLETGSFAGDQKIKSLPIIYEIGPFLIWPVVFLLLVKRLLGKTTGMLFMLLLFSTAYPLSSALGETMAAGRESYLAGDFESAREIFEAHYLRAPQDPRLVQALASAYYKLSSYDTAIVLFSELYTISDSDELRFIALYNLGNSHLLNGQAKLAVEKFESAILIKSEPRAIHNLQVAKKLLSEEFEKVHDPGTTAEEEELMEQLTQQLKSPPSAEKDQTSSAARDQQRSTPLPREPIHSEDIHSEKGLPIEGREAPLLNLLEDLTGKEAQALLRTLPDPSVLLFPGRPAEPSALAVGRQRQVDPEQTW